MNHISSIVLRYRPPRIAMALLLLALATNWILPSTRLELFTSGPLAVFCASLGFSVMMWAWWLFQKAETAICPTAQSSALVTRGIYRYTRNPMYLGMLLMMVGVALWIGDLGFYLVNLVYFLVIDRVFCPFEEQRLRETFGADYERYSASVGRWV